MEFDPDEYHRRSIRIPGYDYSLPGGYFVTLVSYERSHLFGAVIDGEMQLNEFGRIAQEEWFKTAALLRPRAVQRTAPTPDGPAPGSLGVIVRAFKSSSVRRINLLRKRTGLAVWQRNYYEHVIRDNADYLSKLEYILNNPINWETDEER